MNDYRTRTVPVRGGELAVGEWGPSDGPAVLAVHGVTASHLAWPLLASFLPDAHFIAPDLRGRGRSNGLPGPWGMPQHADDLAAVLDTLGVESAIVVGHSMGAFASVVFAHRYPNKVTSLVLVDGGLPLPVPPGLSDDDATRAILGPAAERLSMTFESLESYREFWKHHPAFANTWSAWVEDYIAYDLVGTAPNLRSASSFDAVAADSIELRGSDSLRLALDGLAHPTTFVSAPRGLLNETPPLYPKDSIERWTQALPGLKVVSAENVNHYTIVMAEDGARVVANVIRGELNNSGSAAHSAAKLQEKVEPA